MKRGLHLARLAFDTGTSSHLPHQAPNDEQNHPKSRL